jgi:hypothetical protein
MISPEDPLERNHSSRKDLKPVLGHEQNVWGTHDPDGRVIAETERFGVRRRFAHGAAGEAVQDQIG